MARILRALSGQRAVWTVNLLIAYISAWLLLPACAISALAGTTTLRIGLAFDPDNLDPTFFRSGATVQVLRAVCDKLIDVTPDFRYVPQLATQWSWASDYKKLLITLRPDVKF